jgi:hypothetical protein
LDIDGPKSANGGGLCQIGSKDAKGRGNKKGARESAFLPI